MKNTGKTNLPAALSSKVLSFTPDSDLLQKSITRKQVNRKSRNPGGGVRRKREGVPATGKRGSRPDTPLLRWKFDEGKEEEKGVEVESEKLSDAGRKNGRRARGGRDVAPVSARKLAAGLWRLQPPEVRVNVGGEVRSVPKNNGFPIQPTIVHSGIHSPGSRSRKSFDSQTKDVPPSPNSVSAQRNKFLYKLEPMFHFSNSAMEGVTKWDPGSWKPSEDIKRIYVQSNHLEDQVGVVSMMSVLESELKQAHERVHELETERRSSKKKLEQFLKKLSEERVVWRSREHEKVRAVIDDMKGELNWERKNRRRLEMVNSKLVSEWSDAKLSAKRYLQEYEKEKKTRELIEEVCNELANEIGEDKAEVEALKRESTRVREEVDDERKMLQMAEVWREERVQMKLVDAKVTLEEKYSQMNEIVADLQDFLSSKGVVLDEHETRRAETLRESAASVREIRELSYEPPNAAEDMFSVFEDVGFREMGAKEAGPFAKVDTIYPEIDSFRHSTAYLDGEEDDDESGWETVSHVEDHGSSHSPDHDGTETSEVCSVESKPLKKASSISRLWPSSHPNHHGKTMNGGRMSSDQSSVEQGSSPESGVTKGCMEWPRGAMQKQSLKSKLMEARMESEKVQLRQVLKQKI